MRETEYFQAFDDYDHMIADLLKNGLIEEDVAKAVLLSLMQSRQYLRFVTCGE